MIITSSMSIVRARISVRPAHVLISAEADAGRSSGYMHDGTQITCFGATSGGRLDDAVAGQADTCVPCAGLSPPSVMAADVPPAPAGAAAVSIPARK